MNPELGPFGGRRVEPLSLGEGTVYTHPDDVLSDPTLSASGKKEVLASWISDARAVENAPSLRQLDSGAVIEVDAILQALVSLDPQAPDAMPEQRRPPPSCRRRNLRVIASRASTRKSANDNDDDPPPSPAGLGTVFRPTFVAAHGAPYAQVRKVAIA